MSPLRLRPELRLPWQVIAAFATAVYVLRSAMRGWDFRPDLSDVIVFGGLALILLARPLAGRLLRGSDDDEERS